MSLRRCLWGMLLMTGCARGEGAAKPTVPTPAEPNASVEVAKPSGPYAITLHEDVVPLRSYRFMHNSIPFIVGQVPEGRRKLMAMEFLVQRELLAQAAAKLNFRVEETDARASVEAGVLYLLGHKVDGKRVYFEEDDSGGAKFAPLYLERLVLGSLKLSSVGEFHAEQRRERLAQLMREEISRSEKVSEDTVREFYISQNATVSADYVRFDIRNFQSKLDLTKAMVQRYVDTHEEQLETEWYKAKPRWQGDRARVELSILKIERDGVAPKVAKKSIVSALATIRAGLAFGTVAATSSQHRSAGLGGYIGWRGAKAIGFGQEVVAACAGLAAGDVSDIIETPSAYYLVRMESRSSKGLRFEQMKFTLATKMAPRSIARMQARNAAKDALASSLPLAKQYPESEQRTSNAALENLPAEILAQLSPDQLQTLMSTSTEYSSGAPALRHVEGIRQAQEEVGGLKYAKEVVKALWGDVALGTLVPEVFEVDDGDAFVIAQPTERVEADMEAFKRASFDIRTTLTRERGEKAVQAWVVGACEALLAANAVTANAELLVLETGEALGYEPCALLMETP